MKSEAFTAFFGENREGLVAGKRYRPLSVVTFALEMQLFAEWDEQKEEYIAEIPGVSHFFNAVTYGIAGMMLFLFLLQLFPDARKNEHWWATLPFWVSLIFIVHPVHSEVVANIKGRDEILALLFGLLGMIAALEAVDRAKIHLMAVSCAGFFLAYLSKESAFPFILIAPLCLHVFRRGVRLEDFAIVTAPAIIAMGSYLVLRFQFIGGFGGGQSMDLMNNPFAESTGVEHLSLVSHAAGKYLGLMAFPLQLSHDYYPYALPKTAFDHPGPLIGLLLNFGLLAYGIYGSLKKRPEAFGLLIYFMLLAPVSNLFFPIGTQMGERFLFMPALGFILFAVYMLRIASKKWDISLNVSLGILGVVSLLLALRTFTRNPVWQDNLSLFTTDVKQIDLDADDGTGSAKLLTAAGGILIDSSKTAAPADKMRMLMDAQKYLNRAVTIHPTNREAWFQLTRAKLEANAPAEETYRAAQTAASVGSPRVSELQALGIAAFRAKHYEESIAAYRSLTRAKGGEVARPWYNIGTCYRDMLLMNTGSVQPAMVDSALSAFNRALSRSPQSGDVHAEIGTLYGRYYLAFDKAKQEFDTALNLGYNKSWVYENYGITMAQAGAPDQAVAIFRKGLQFHPRSAALLGNMSVAYRQLGDSIRADSAFQAAQRLNSPQ